MTKSNKRHARPIMLESYFDCDQTNAVGRVRHYLDTLTYFRPRGFSKLAREGARFIRQLEAVGDDATGEASDVYQFADEWKSDVESLLTEHGRKVERNPYIVFGQYWCSGDVGYYVYLDNVEADLYVDDLADVPRGFSGEVICRSDHGNVSLYTYSRGRNTRCVFSIG